MPSWSGQGLPGISLSQDVPQRERGTEAPIVRGTERREKEQRVEPEMENGFVEWVGFSNRREVNRLF